MKVLTIFYQKLKTILGFNGVILPSLEQLPMKTFLEIIQTRNLKLLNKKANEEQLNAHWIKLYDEFWLAKNNSLAKLLLRKENEKLVLAYKIKILYSIYNAIASLSKIPINDKSIQQKGRLIELYIKQTKNELNMFSSYGEIAEKIKSSINNFENQLSKLTTETKDKATKEINNSIDIILEVAVILKMPIDVNKITVMEFLSYEKIAIKKVKGNGEQ